MTDDQPEDKHQFHSPLNSNAIVTASSETPSTLLTTLPPLLDRFVNYVIIKTTDTVVKVKFINKEDAKTFSSLIAELDGGDKLQISTEYDALTHPGNIYVRGLLPELNTQDLLQLFEPFGQVTSCKIVMDEYGRSKGYGFVNFTDGESADEAIEKLNGMLVNGSKLYLNHHIAKKERLERLDFEKQNFTNLYVKNIPDDYDEEKLKAMFEVYGEISTVFIPEIKRNENTPPDLKRFGFVNMQSHESALKALEELDGKEIAPGITMQVSRAQRRDERNSSQTQSTKLSPMSMSVSVSPSPIPVNVIPQQFPIQPPQPPQPPINVQQHLSQLPLPGPNQQQSNLYVKNLAPTIDDGRLFELFAPYGIIISARTMTEMDGTPRGFGFVCFKTLQEAANALVMMNGSVVDGLVIGVNYAQRNMKRSKMNGQQQGPGYYGDQMRGGYYYPPMMGGMNGNYMMGGNMNGRYNGKKPSMRKNVTTTGHYPSNGLSEKDKETVDLSAEIAVLGSDDDKRAKFIDSLVVPLLARRDPTLTESQMIEQSDAVADKFLAQYKDNEANDDYWLEVVSDWNKENSVEKLLEELKL